MCAVYNPDYNTLLTTNLGTKVAAITYQNDDPMTVADGTVRETYYSVNGWPATRNDGTSTPDHPSGWTQSVINNECAIASPFTIDLNWNFNSTYDSISVSCIVTATQAITMTTPKLQVTMIERKISFANAPGINGEKEFWNVCRKMLPNASGTTIATSWTVGQSYTFTTKILVPFSIIYRLDQIAFVAFVQDNSNKSVKQAAYAAPKTIINASDAGITAINVPAFQCNFNPIAPVVTLKNFASTPLTSCKINYQIDAGTVQTQNWTGNLGSGSTTNVTLTSITPTFGNHKITVYPSQPNNSADVVPSNNTNTSEFYIFNTPQATAVSQEFTSTTFPPTNWIASGPHWIRSTASSYGVGTGSAEARFWDPNITSTILGDHIYAPAMNFAGGNGFYLTFDHAYMPYYDNYAEIQVHVSTNCGSTWNTVFTKSGSALVTAASVNSPFTPTSSQWAHDSVNLSSYAGNPNVLIRIYAAQQKAGYSNNLYLDKINIKGNFLTDITEEINNVDFKVYPNPFSKKTSLKFNTLQTSNVNVEIYNVIGKSVYHNNGIYDTGEHIINIDGSNLSEGVYFIKLNVNDKIYSEKLILTK